MLRIRLQRVGRKNIPTFRVVLTDSRNSTKSGRFLEVLGMYDPVRNVKTIKEDRVKHWIAMGAKPTDTMHNFLVSKKVVEGKKRNVFATKRKKASATSEKAPASAAPTATVASAPTEEVKAVPSTETPA